LLPSAYRRAAIARREGLGLGAHARRRRTQAPLRIGRGAARDRATGTALDASGRARAGPLRLEARRFVTPSAGTLLDADARGTVSLADRWLQILVGTASAQAPPRGRRDAVTGGVSRWLALAVNGKRLAPRLPPRTPRANREFERPSNSIDRSLVVRARRSSLSPPSRSTTRRCHALAELREHRASALAIIVRRLVPEGFSRARAARCPRAIRFVASHNHDPGDFPES
jgi:hypothetical protein